MSQRITYTYIKNFKGIKEIEANDLTRFVAVFGANGAGKTSFLEAIKNAIKLEKGGNSKVRIGEEEGVIEVHFEDFKIKRIIGEKGKLEVEHNGELVKRPQEWLDSVFMGTIGDPQKFLNLHNKEKIKYILETHGKKTQFDELEEQRVKLYDHRTDVHRTLLAKEEELKQTDVADFNGATEENIDITTLQEELNQVEAHNQGYYDLQSRIEKGDMLIEQSERIIQDTDTVILDRSRKIQDLQRKLEQAMQSKAEAENKKKSEAENLSALKKHKAELEKEIQAFVKKDTSEITARINAHSEKQRVVADMQARKKIYEQQEQKRNELKAEWKSLDDEIKAIEIQQNDLVKELDLSYKIKLEDGVMSVHIDDQRIPLDELNTAAQLDLGVDICLSGPNQVKIITIENANALDPKTMERIKAKIEAKEAQCFLETVYKTGYESITIQDGEGVL